jgi:hypothetical protein
MYKNTKEPVCIKCKGQGVVEVFEPEVGFEVLVSCPECNKGNDAEWIDFEAEQAFDDFIKEVTEEMEAAKDITVGEIIKKDTEKLIIARKEYEGHPYIDIRQFFLSDTGDWLPTKKGVTVSPKKVKSLIDILQKVTQ